MIHKALMLLNLFLPTLVYNDTQRNLSWKLWVDEFLTMWQAVQNNPSWEIQLVTLFARLAHNNIGHINWSNCVPIVFTKVLRSFKLPVGNLQYAAALDNETTIHSMCSWIVSMLGGPVTKPVLQNLRQLLNATKIFFHPSNEEKWSGLLCKFIVCITDEFVSRVNRERYKIRKWEPEIQDNYRITDADIEEFVKMVKPVTLLALYSKVDAMPSSKVLQFLTYLRADLVMPDLLEKAYTAFDTLTTPHQTTACFTALCFTTGPALNGYPEVRRHIAPLLFQCLPALDPNDFSKTTVAFEFIYICLNIIPIVDCSTAPQFYSDMSESDKNVCFTTTQFENFVIQFFDRCFVLVKSMTHETETTQESLTNPDLTQSDSDNSLSKILIATTTILLQQCSKKIFIQCLNKLFQFATTHLLQGHMAMSTAAKLCAATAKADPVASFAKYIPHYYRQIIAYFEDNPDAQHNEKVDKQLSWDMKILSEICHIGTHHLLQYKDLLFEVALHAISMTAKEGYEAGVRIIKFCIRG